MIGLSKKIGFAKTNFRNKFPMLALARQPWHKLFTGQSAIPAYNSPIRNGPPPVSHTERRTVAVFQEENDD